MTNHAASLIKVIEKRAGERSPVLALKGLCLATIRDNMEHFCQGPIGPDLQGPFEDLPPEQTHMLTFQAHALVNARVISAVSLMTDLFQLVTPILRPEHHLAYLVGTNLQHVHLSNETDLLSFPRSEDHFDRETTQDQILARIARKGKSLRSLVVTQVYNNSVTYGELMCTLGQLSALQELTLYVRTPGIVDDATMAVIGAAMPRLRKLTVDSKAVTNKGMNNICVKGQDGICESCTDLTFLDVGGTSIDTRGLLMALQSFPKLRQLHPCIKVNDLLTSLKENDLQNEKLNLKGYGVICTSQEDLNEFIYSCTKLEKIYIHSRESFSIDKFGDTNISNINLSVLTRLLPSQIKHLTICKFMFTSSHFADILSHHGPSMSEVKLEDTGNTVIDLENFSFCCPNLRRLWLSKCHLIVAPKQNKNCVGTLLFKNLEEVHIEEQPLSPHVLPAWWQHLLSTSTMLTSVYIAQASQFTDVVLMNVLATALINDNVLKRMKTFRLNSCLGISGIWFKALMCVAPSLNCIVVNNCKSFTIEERDILTTFVRESNLKIKFKYCA